MPCWAALYWRCHAIGSAGVARRIGAHVADRILDVADVADRGGGCMMKVGSFNAKGLR